MASSSKCVLGLSGALLLLMVLFPPYFGIDVESDGQLHSALGYYSIWSPPSAEYVYETLTSESSSDLEDARLASFRARLNLVRLSFNIVALGVATVVVLLVLSVSRRARQAAGHRSL